LFNARLKLSGKLLIQTTRFSDFHIRSQEMATILDLLYHFYTLATTIRDEKARLQTGCALRELPDGGERLYPAKKRAQCLKDVCHQFKRRLYRPAFI
jgi:hypothetical protein